MRAFVPLLTQVSLQRDDKLSTGAGTTLPYVYMRARLPTPFIFLGWTMLIEHLYSEFRKFM